VLAIGQTGHAVARSTASWGRHRRSDHPAARLDVPKTQPHWLCTRPGPLGGGPRARSSPTTTCRPS